MRIADATTPDANDAGGGDTSLLPSDARDDTAADGAPLGDASTADGDGA